MLSCPDDLSVFIKCMYYSVLMCFIFMRYSHETVRENNKTNYIHNKAIKETVMMSVSVEIVDVKLW